MGAEIELSEVLSRYYNIECSSITPINSGTANKNYLVGCKDRQFVIRKRNPKYSSDLWIQYETEYLNHISNKKIPAALPLKNMEGLDYCRMEESVYQVFSYIGGENFDCGRLEDVSESGAFLGKLHMALADFQPLHKKILPRYDSPSMSLEILDLHLKKYNGTINMEEKKALDYISNQARLVLDNLPDDEYDNLPKIVIHGDYHPANVKYENGKVCGLFDFDWISSQPRLRDIIDGLIYFASIRSENIAGGDIFSLTGGYILDIQRSKVFLDAYTEYGNKPLTPREFECIPYFIRARLIHSRIQALSKIPEERVVEMLTRGIKEPLLWLDENQDKMLAVLMS